jgi:hypothetical protein
MLRSFLLFFIVLLASCANQESKTGESAPEVPVVNPTEFDPYLLPFLDQKIELLTESGDSLVRYSPCLAAGVPRLEFLRNEEKGWLLNTNWHQDMAQHEIRSVALNTVSTITSKTLGKEERL